MPNPSPGPSPPIQKCDMSKVHDLEQKGDSAKQHNQFAEASRHYRAALRELERSPAVAAWKTSNDDSPPRTEVANYVRIKVKHENSTTGQFQALKLGDMGGLGDNWHGFVSSTEAHG